MFTGEVGVISNRATWLSQEYEVVDEADGTTTDLTGVAVLDIVVTVRGITGSVQDYGVRPPSYVYATASIANGKVTVPGPGFQWQFEDTDLSGICAGTYRIGVKVTMDGFISDMIIGDLTVIEGN
jgi:hypothetical protein